MLLEAAAMTPGVRKTPEPRVRADGALGLLRRVHAAWSRLEEADKRVLRAERAQRNVQDVFNEHGVQIMSPHYEGDPDGKVWVPKEKWHEPPAHKNTQGERMTTARALQPEDEIAHYRIVGPLGAGGMGEVYLAQDRTLERNVALKILPPDLVRSEDRVRRFVLEAKSASSLSHPNIVTIYEIGQDAVRSARRAATRARCTTSRWSW